VAKLRRKTAVSKSQVSSTRLLSELWGLIVWLVGVLVALAVGFGMIGRNGVPILKIMYIPDIVTVTAGWFVVILVLLGVLLKIIDKVGG